jgi:CheY-like chemotaxis protein
VADDEPSLRLLCRINLEAEGYRVLEAASEADVDRLLAEDDVTAPPGAARPAARLLHRLGAAAWPGGAVARRRRDLEAV